MEYRRYLLKGNCLITLENGADSVFYRIEGKSVRMLDDQWDTYL